VREGRRESVRQDFEGQQYRHGKPERALGDTV